MLVLLCGRLLNLSTTTISVANQTSTRVREIAHTRGVIYDCNLKPLVNKKCTYTFLLKPTQNNIALLTSMGYDHEVIAKLQRGNLVTIETDNKTLFTEGTDIKALRVFERYCEPPCVHIIGYTNSEGTGVSGIEKYYNDYLTDTGGTLSIAYSADANGRLLTAEAIEIRNHNYYTPQGLVLTIDGEIQKIAENALKNNKIKKGAVVVLDTESGGIVACASVPCYNPESPAEALSNTDAPFINRCFSAYPVGSVFKLVTAISGLEKGINLPRYTCTGQITKSGNTFNCSKTDGHGETDLTGAISQSCNPYFIELGTMVGATSLLQTAELSGFGRPVDLGNGYLTDSGILPDINDLNSGAAVGNFAFGQGKFTATPLQVAAFVNTIATDGIYNEPHLVKGYADSKGAFSPIVTDSPYRIFNTDTCTILKNAMRNTTIDGTGTLAFSSLFNSCGKTATAQSGQYDETGREIKICWYAGFFPAESPRYTLCIMVEDGVSGGTDCAPVFKEICENIYIQSK